MRLFLIRKRVKTSLIKVAESIVACFRLATVDKTHLALAINNRPKRVNFSRLINGQHTPPVNLCLFKINSCASYINSCAVQNSPTGFMPPSPLMHDHQALMAAHLQNSLNPALQGFAAGMMPGRPSLSNFGSPFSAMATGKMSPHEAASLAMGRHTPHSDGSAGSGSAGNGPTLNGTIEVKLEEVRYLKH